MAHVKWYALVLGTQTVVHLPLQHCQVLYFFHIQCMGSSIILKMEAGSRTALRWACRGLQALACAQTRAAGDSRL